MYCTKEKPYLTKIVESGRYYAVGKKDMKTLGYATEGELREASLNGTICFECEINKVEEIRHAYSPLGDDLFFTKSVSIPVDFEKRTCLNTEQLNSYLPYYALYLTNVKAIKPKHVYLVRFNKEPPEPFFYDRYFKKEITKAPQNMCKGYYLENGVWKEYILISIRPKHLCNIANGLKDIETRRQVVNEIKGIEK